MYEAPTIRELGTVAAYTLSSGQQVTLTGQKPNNQNADLFTGFSGKTGTPCTTVPGNIPCD